MPSHRPRPAPRATRRPRPPRRSRTAGTPPPRGGAPAERLPAGARDVLGPIAASARALAPGRVRVERDPRGWGRVVVSGPGRRRLPGGATDGRVHAIVAAFDGSFLQMTYRVAGRLADSLFLFAPAPRDAVEMQDFLDRHARRIAPA